MRETQKKKFRCGFSLVEQLFSILVIALLLPTALAGLSLGLSLKKESTIESVGREVSAYVFSQLPYVWKEERSLLFPAETPLVFPTLSDSGALHFLFTEEALPYDASPPFTLGDIDWLLTEAEAGRVSALPPEVASGYIVTVQEETLDNPQLNPDLLRSFSVTVSHPAGAPPEARKHVIFQKLLRKR